jgi:hypothetical protein
MMIIALWYLAVAMIGVAFIFWGIWLKAYWDEATASSHSPAGMEGHNHVDLFDDWSTVKSETVRARHALPSLAEMMMLLPVIALVGALYWLIPYRRPEPPDRFADTVNAASIEDIRTPAGRWVKDPRTKIYELLPLESEEEFDAEE